MSDQRRTGIILVLAATVLWSTAGVFVRLVELDAWTILGWRSVFAAAALGIIVLLQKRDEGTASLTSTLLVVPVAVVSMAAYVVSLTLTTVANVMVVYATVPLVAAGLAFVLLREPISRATLLASLVAVVGVVVVVGGAIRPHHVLGITVAFAMTLAMGLQIVMARKFPAMNMALVNCIAASLCAVGGLSLSGWDLPSMPILIVLAIFGITNTALAYYFVLRGARLIPSSEVGLISTLDVVLGPLWVWLLFSEDPGTLTIIGGSVVFVAVVGYLLSQRKAAEVS